MDFQLLGSYEQQTLVEQNLNQELADQILRAGRWCDREQWLLGPPAAASKAIQVGMPLNVDQLDACCSDRCKGSI